MTGCLPFDMYPAFERHRNEKETFKSYGTPYLTHYHQSNKSLLHKETMGGLNPVAKATSYLSVVLCDGSSRKLIAGWWYVFLCFQIIIIIIYGVIGFICAPYEMCLERLYI